MFKVQHKAQEGNFGGGYNEKGMMCPRLHSMGRIPSIILPAPTLTRPHSNSQSYTSSTPRELASSLGENDEADRASPLPNTSSPQHVVLGQIQPQQKAPMKLPSSKCNQQKEAVQRASAKS